MEKSIAPSARKAQELRAMVQGQTDGQSGEELVSRVVRLSPERVLQEAVAHAHAVAWGRERYEPRPMGHGYRHGDEHGPGKTAQGGLRVQRPQSRGREEPYRAQLWRHVATTRDVLKQFIVERSVGGMAQRDIA